MILTMSDILLRVYLPLQVRFKHLLLIWSISLMLTLIIVRSLLAGVLVRIQLKCSLNTLPFLSIILHFYIHRKFSINIIT